MRPKHRFIRTEQCPECAKLGHDNAKDNLGVYSNGKWCFKCGYMESIDGVVRLKELLSYTPTPLPLVFLPEDSNLEYPSIAIDWINRYEISTNDLLNNDVVYSSSLQRLIFPVYGEDNLIAWQGRYFGKEEGKAKWFGKGDLKNTFNILGSADKIVLCEDIISAIKLSKHTMAMPLYGCQVGSERFKRLYKLFGYKFDTRIWLDPDMRPRALKEARLGQQLGLKASVIYSDKDPKEHSHKEIGDLLS
jgi:hypothetical protein